MMMHLLHYLHSFVLEELSKLKSRWFQVHRQGPVCLGVGGIPLLHYCKSAV